MSTLPRESKGFHVTLSVASESQLAELDAAWREIVIGRKLPRTEALKHDTEAAMERAREALARIVKFIEQNVAASTSARLVRFIAGMYNGYDYHVDLTDLRTFDPWLATAVLEYLNYDRLGRAEVHQHLPGGDRQLHRWLEEQDVEPRIRLSSDDRHLARLRAVSRRTGQLRDELVREAIGLALDRYESREYGCLVSGSDEHAWRAGGERPVTHARRLSEKACVRPLCDARSSPWRSSGFRFENLSCEHCQDIVLDRA